VGGRQARAADERTRFSPQASVRSLDIPIGCSVNQKAPNVHSAYAVGRSTAPEEPTVSDKDKERSQKVYQWARHQLNRRVGAGECWDLADRALRQAGARSSATTGVQDNYDWGTPVKPVQAVIPGDILQFRNYTITTTVTTKYPDQSTESTFRTVLRPHHTAIVAANNGAKGLVILEQNLTKGAPVQRNVLHLANGVIKTESKTTSEPGPGGKKQLVVVVVTTTVEVTGQVWAYRAEAKQ
jgi:hypothetical protein